MADLERLYHEHYGFIFKFLVSLCHDLSLAEELTQETFFRAYINLKGLRDDSKAAAWLCRIARNLYYSWCKEQRRLLPLEEQEKACEAPDVAQVVETKVLSKQAMRYLAELEEPYREVFKLHVFGEVPLKQISALYGKHESWARVTFYRAKQKIAERMNQTL